MKAHDLDAVLDAAFPDVRTELRIWREPRIQWVTWTDQAGRVSVTLEGRHHHVQHAAGQLLCRFPLDEGPLSVHDNRSQFVLTAAKENSR